MPANGEVLCQAFHHPKRNTGHIAQIGRVAVDNHVVLKGMNQFMPQYMMGLLVRRGNRIEDPIPQALGHTTCPHADIAPNRIGLMKARMVIIDNGKICLVVGLAP